MLDLETQRCYREFAHWMARLAAGARCPVIGLCGAQGSGKSTAAWFVQQQLRESHGLRAAVLSLDDVYLPRAERLERARRLHPLFATRGVPGTHDVALGLAVLLRLQQLQSGQTLMLPRFSKALDDRLPETDGPVIEGPLDLILFEGWCVGVPPQPPAALAVPVNSLEALEDREGEWRRQVNAYLATSYAQWFAHLDALVFLRVPDLDCVRRWRGQQEQETAREAGPCATRLQSPEQIERFIQHYERLSLHALQVMPERAQVTLQLRPDHGVAQMKFRSP